MKVNLIKTERVLSPTGIEIANYVINPYRGCTFGCKYCYAKKNKNVINRINEWGNFVDVKINLIEKLRREFEAAKKIDRVLIGSITEVFQPIERKYKLMEHILNFLKEKNVPCVILTKSTIVTEYLRLLKYSNKNIIYFTYNSPIIKDLFEKFTPSNKERLKAIKQIVSHKIKLVVYISPYIPFLSDYKQILLDLSEFFYDSIRVYFEAYNIKLGNWMELKDIINDKEKNKIEKIYSSKYSYQKYWQEFKKKVIIENKKYNFKIKFFIYPYDSYYPVST